MSWIARLDARAATWPLAGRWTYWAVKWYLIAFGAFALLRLYLDRMGIWLI